MVAVIYPLNLSFFFVSSSFLGPSTWGKKVGRKWERDNCATSPGINKSSAHPSADDESTEPSGAAQLMDDGDKKAEGDEPVVKVEPQQVNKKPPRHRPAVQVICSI